MPGGITKWDIRVISNEAFVFVDNERLSRKEVNFGSLKSAEVAERKADRTAERKPCIKLSFTPGPKGQRGEILLPMKKYDWSSSDGYFKEIVSMNDESEWTAKCNNCLSKMMNNNLDDNQLDNEIDTSRPSSSKTGSKVDKSTEKEKKRKRSANLIKELTIPSKRTKAENIGTNEDEFKAKTDACRIDGQFYIPVELISLPPKERMLRNVDEVFLKRLKDNMEKLPNGAYEPLYLNVIGMPNKMAFDDKKVAKYKYEVLGGTHNLLATKALLQKYPERKEYEGRYATIFVGLTDHEALWLASRHNFTGSFRHEVTYQDEVEIAYNQLQKMGKRDEEGNAIPSEEWRETCSKILGKSKKNLSEVFSMATLPTLGWENFKTICFKYEKGKLKDQKALPKDMKGKPSFRPSYTRFLHGLELEDRLELLKKVADEEISLVELKELAEQIKLIRPTQNMICTYLGRKWEEIVDNIGDKVAPQQLERFIGKNETDIMFKRFLDQLKQQSCENEIENEDNVTIASSNVYMTNSQNKGVICKCNDPMTVEQGSCVQDGCGFSLSIYKLPPNVTGESSLSHTEKIVRLVERLNFSVRQIFNVIIWGDAEAIFPAKKWIYENRGSCVEVGYVNRKDGKPSGNLGMEKSVSSFLVYHAAIRREMLPDHFNFERSTPTGNLICASATSDVDVYKEFIRLFSHQDDWILDINSAEGSAVIAALESNRNGVCLQSLEDDIFKTRRKFSQYISRK